MVNFTLSCLFKVGADNCKSKTAALCCWVRVCRNGNFPQWTHFNHTVEFAQVLWTCTFQSCKCRFYLTIKCCVHIPFWAVMDHITPVHSGMLSCRVIWLHVPWVRHLGTAFEMEINSQQRRASMAILLLGLCWDSAERPCLPWTLVEHETQVAGTPLYSILELLESFTWSRPHLNVSA